MLPCVPEVLPRNITDVENYAHISRALAHKANNAFARFLQKNVGPAGILKLEEAGDSLQPARQDGDAPISLTAYLQVLQTKGAGTEELKANPGREDLHQALQYHGLARAYEKMHRDHQTDFQRLKPNLMKGIFATAIVAEIVSIPVLLLSCVMMLKPQRPSKHVAAAA